ncbi:DUF262 domain-containing protein [Ramlibacter tataouinensis]|uniref:DUF262 domain-containing protein n=1 Tax=Ramlibacter tataouinensis TaxID=94132 RepID=UPI0022F3D0D7|nr:DUF262 domain-containing protein [Ramlibacter tataouinensis]WBY03295.1 DUF262 domain-containing protein [Ramlibacter tataouinensis]
MATKLTPEAEDFALIPDDQQEDEDDIHGEITSKDAVVMNADWTIETLNGQINKGNIDLQPGFQRRAAWDDTRKSRLVESIIVGMPIPNIVLAENKKHRGRFIVIDGKQRLLAINDFLNGKFSLRGLDIRDDLNERTFAQLPSEDREFLENSTLRSSLIKNWADDNFLFAIFFRLNSGSLPLSPQELRKALIGGNLLDAIEAYLQASKPFQSIFGNGLDKRMRDSELVLRFIAYDRALEEYRGDFKEFLDQTTRFFEADWNQRKPAADEAMKRLDGALTAAHAVFGRDAFKKWVGGKYERVINRAVFDCVVRFFAEPAVAKAAVQKRTQVVQAFHKVCLSTEFKDAIEKTTKSLEATKTRIDIWGLVLADVLRLKYDSTIRRIA